TAKTPRTPRRENYALIVLFFLASLASWRFNSLPRASLAQAKPADDGQIAGAVLVAKVQQQARPCTDHLQQTAPTGMVFFVRAHVLVQLVNARREQSDLHFRRTSIYRFASELVDDLRLTVLRDTHLALYRLRR